jgi:hypothetical protein
MAAVKIKHKFISFGKNAKEWKGIMQDRMNGAWRELRAECVQNSKGFMYEYDILLLMCCCSTIVNMCIIFACRRFGTIYLFHLQRLALHTQPLKMEQIEGSEKSACKNQTPGIHPKDCSQNPKHGESLKSRMCIFIILHTTFYV